MAATRSGLAWRWCTTRARCALLSLILLACALLSASPGEAHPHARFSYQLDPVLRDGEVVALRVRWMLDPLSSLLAMRGMDLNRNGRADPEELAAFARQNDQLVAAQAYFLSLSTQDQPQLGFRISQGLRAEIQAQRIQLHFEVALDQPQRDGLAVRFFDASWYVALNAEDPPVAAGHTCQGIADNQSLETQGWGTQSVPVVRLSCRGV